MRTLIFFPILIFLMVGCARFDVDRSLDSFDEEQYAKDHSDCYDGSAGELIGNTLGAALVTSLSFVVEGLTQGNVSGKGISAMAAGGGIFGAGVGAAGTTQKDSGRLERCLEARGYSER